MKPCRDSRVPSYVDECRDYAAMNLPPLGITSELGTQG
jgi:hypothetical protein